jgi:alpha-tubulin suppressor-like RCC1 family protein
LDTSGAAHCWGRNQFGQLGNGSTSDQNTPSAVILGLNFVDLAGSYGNFTCGLTGEGKAYCWGYNRYGQLGDGSTQDSPVPRLVGSGRVFTSLHVGTYAACGIDPGGDTYCWGSNLYGQLGTGDVDDRLTPTLLSGHGQQYQSITMMRNAACGTTVDGTVYCWGLNSSSELGIGVDAYALEPIEVLPLR